MASKRRRRRHRSLPAPGEVRAALDGYAVLTGARSAHTTGANAHADLCALPAVARLWEAATCADMAPARVYLARRGCWPGRHVRVPLPAQSVRWLAREAAPERDEAAGWHGLPPGAAGAVVFAWRPGPRPGVTLRRALGPRGGGPANERLCGPWRRFLEGPGT